MSETQELSLAKDDAILVFKSDGKMDLYLPVPEDMSELVPPHVALAASIAKAVSDETLSEKLLSILDF